MRYNDTKHGERDFPISGICVDKMVKADKATVAEHCDIGGNIISRLDNGTFVGLIYSLLVFS